MRRESDILALLVVASSKATKALWFDLSNKRGTSRVHVDLSRLTFRKV